MDQRPTRRGRINVAGAISVLLLAACGSGSGPSSPSGPTGSAGGTGTPSAAASAPSASVEPADVFTFAGSSPVVTRELAGLPGDRYVNPGAVIASGGVLHMFANVFTQWPGTLHVVHLTSTDGRTWLPRTTTPILTNAAVPFADPGFDVSSGYVATDGTWHLIIESVSSTAPWAIGEATAPGPDGPWAVRSTPLLTPGPAGSLDAGGMHWAWIVHVAEGYLLYYTAFPNQSSPGVIAVATSPDGITWTKRNEPVLIPDRDWERGVVDRPRVAATAGGLTMLYSAAKLTDRGEARSDDGLTWTKVGAGPAIDATRFPVQGLSWDCALVALDGRLLYLLEIGSTSGGTNVYAAFSGS